MMHISHVNSKIGLVTMQPKLYYATKMIYSKALRCMFFGEWKNSCSSKFVQLELLNKAKTRSSKNRAVQDFHYINSCISNCFGPYLKMCIVKVLAA